MSTSLVLLLLLLARPATSVAPQRLFWPGMSSAEAPNASVGCFQIPVLLQLPGAAADNLTLLAFAEARRRPSCYHVGETTIGSRRSTDGGRTW
eukprot:SAG11_NODE_14087_length_625_cov_1.758555_1_plen_93_part_00